MEVLHIPSGGVKINGVAYLASGAGVHPTFVFFHGLPGNEKNLDIAQAVRRDGWNAITVNYRGSWGSPGEFRFGNNLEDADAVLAFLRDPGNARSLGIDTSRLVIAGHSMGGWVVALTAAHDRGLLGAILISAADMSNVGTKGKADLVRRMAASMESLAGVTAESMADELLGGAAKWRVADAVPGLARLPLLVMSSDDGLRRAVGLPHQARPREGQHTCAPSPYLNPPPPEGGQANRPPVPPRMGLGGFPRRRAPSSPRLLHSLEQAPGSACRFAVNSDRSRARSTPCGRILCPSARSRH